MPDQICPTRCAHQSWPKRVCYNNNSPNTEFAQTRVAPKKIAKHLTCTENLVPRVGATIAPPIAVPMRHRYRVDGTSWPSLAVPMRYRYRVGATIAPPSVLRRPPIAVPMGYLYRVGATVAPALRYRCGTGPASVLQPAPHRGTDAVPVRRRCYNRPPIAVPMR